MPAMLFFISRRIHIRIRLRKLTRQHNVFIRDDDVVNVL
jgi:hypothetical protein